MYPFKKGWGEFIEQDRRQPGVHARTEGLFLLLVRARKSR